MRFALNFFAVLLTFSAFVVGLNAFDLFQSWAIAIGVVLGGLSQAIIFAALAEILKRFDLRDELDDDEDSDPDAEDLP